MCTLLGRQLEASTAQAEIATLVRACGHGRHEWIHGRVVWDDPGSPIGQAGDATIFGPFGGIAPPGVPPVIQVEAQRAIAQRFKGGEGSTEVVRTIVTGDLAVLVVIDRSHVTFDGHAERQPWALRITDVFRREAGTWIRVHRHADPLVRFRDLDDTLALLGDD